MGEIKDIMVNGVSLSFILEEHRKWLCSGYGTYASLGGANLGGANLGGASLGGADLRGADLGGADLRGADLGGANLRDTDLRDTDLRGADLRGADLRGAEEVNTCLYNELTSFFALQCPEEGSFVAWKKCQNNKIVKLEIPSEAKRSSATSRKCRAEFVKVLDVQDADGNIDEEGIAFSNHDSSEYKIGEIYYPDSFDENRWDECSNGVHFFIIRQEAVNY